MNFVLTNEKIQERIINKANSGNLKFEKFELDYLKESSTIFDKLIISIISLSANKLTNINIHNRTNGKGLFEITSLFIIPSLHFLLLLKL